MVTPGVPPGSALINNPARRWGAVSSDCAANSGLAAPRTCEEQGCGAVSSDCAANGVLAAPRTCEYKAGRTWNADRVAGDAALHATLVAPNAKSCIKGPNSKARPNRTDGNLGRGNRYRLSEASFSPYHLHEMGEADRVDNLTPDLRESFRRTIDAAADFCRVCPHVDYRAPREEFRPVVPTTDGRRYWFGIAKGLRKAKQLLIDLGDDLGSQTGWPIY